MGPPDFCWSGDENGFPLKYMAHMNGIYVFSSYLIENLLHIQQKDQRMNAV
jgi:hypothetical protein